MTNYSVTEQMHRNAIARQKRRARMAAEIATGRALLKALPEAAQKALIAAEIEKAGS